MCICWTPSHPHGILFASCSFPFWLTWSSIKWLPLFCLESLKDEPPFFYENFLQYSLKQTNKQTKKSINWLPSNLSETHLVHQRQKLLVMVPLPKKLKQTNNVRAALSWCAAVNKWTKGWVHLILQSQHGAPNNWLIKKRLLASLSVPHEDRSTGPKDNRLLLVEKRQSAAWEAAECSVWQASPSTTNSLIPVLGGG